MRATHGLGQNGQRCAGTNFVRDRRRRVQHRAEQTGQQHHRQCAVLDQLGIVAKTEVGDGGQKDVEQRRTAHEQQKNRLPHQFHERIAGDGKKLPHGRFIKRHRLRIHRLIANGYSQSGGPRDR